MEDAVCDFAEWEPGMTVVCVLCNGERGGDDPPGPWFRHKPSHRRRVPIYGTPHYKPLGYFEYVHP